MCWKLEFNRGTKLAKNHITCSRITLNIIGLLLVLIIGAIAAVFATYSTEWFPKLGRNDNHHAAIGRNDPRIVMLTKDNIQYCTNTTNDPKKMMGTYVFKCGNNALSECLPMSLRCDGYRDCYNDESDELNCADFCRRATRRKIRFQCNVQDDEDVTEDVCINADYRCDGEVDCTAESEDNNDESSCPNTFEVLATGIKCSVENSFVCADNQLCVRPEDRCNGYENCYDGSDEVGCN
ncbi:very low-density lipoprotein receptor-like [Watersipora subatra]|uniref:very low-density lipoprotein receptor-like n=1 Tax=Watersipora subatra TaxID=2589382 RepID=UPI00355C278B